MLKGLKNIWKWLSGQRHCDICNELGRVHHYNSGELDWSLCEQHYKLMDAMMTYRNSQNK